MAKCATGDNGSGEESYGLQAHHALVVRGQTLLAVIPEADLPSGHDKCVDLGGRRSRRVLSTAIPTVFGGNRAAEWEQRLNGVSYQTISAQGAELTPPSRQPATVRRKICLHWRSSGWSG